MGMRQTKRKASFLASFARSFAYWERRLGTRQPINYVVFVSVMVLWLPLLSLSSKNVRTHLNRWEIQLQQTLLDSWQPTFMADGKNSSHLLDRGAVCNWVSQNLKQSNSSERLWAPPPQCEPIRTQSSARETRASMSRLTNVNQSELKAQRGKHVQVSHDSRLVLVLTLIGRESSASF